MNPLSIFLATLLLNGFALQIASAGGRDVGNGGEVVVCRGTQGAITSIELLDTYEARVLRNVGVQLGSPEMTVEQKVAFAIHRIDAFNPSRSARYLKWLEHFMQGVVWEEDPLPATPDVDPSLFPKGCAIEQIAIQRNTTNNMDWYEYGPAVRISKPLWDALSTDQRAALVLHEIIYHEAMIEPVISAEPIRYTNSLFLSGKIETISLLDYLDLLIPIHGKTVDLNGVHSDHPMFKYSNWKSKAFYPNGQVRCLMPVPGELVSIQGKRLGVKSDEEICFYDHDRLIKSVTLQVPGEGVSLRSSVGDIVVRSGELDLLESGLLSIARIEGEQLIQSGAGLVVTCDTVAEFTDRYLAACGISRQGTISGPGVNLSLVVRDGAVIFDKGKLDWTGSPSKRGWTRSARFDGVLTIASQAVEVKNLGWYPNYSTAAGELVSPAEFRLKGGTIAAEGTISLYTGNLVHTLMPIRDFEYQYKGSSVPIAASIRCGFSGAIKNLEVEWDPDGELITFVPSRDFEMEGQRFKRGYQYEYSVRYHEWQDNGAMCR